jgi:chromosome partitioning protein
VAGLKGGVAKSTVSVSLASARGNTLLIDADDGSASAMRWAELAGPSFPVTVGLATADLPRRLAGLDAANRAVVVIDTGPSNVAVLRSALSVCDVAVLPCRPSPSDTSRVWATRELCEAAGVPVLTVLTFTRSGTLSRVAAREALKSQGVRVAKVELPQRESISRAFGEPVVGELADFGAALFLELTRLVKGTR